MHVLIKRKLEGPSIPELGQPTSATFDSVTVPVARPSTGPAALASYELQRSLDGTTWSTIATGPGIFGNPAAQYVDGGRAALTLYFYRARATDTAGRVSDFCAPASVTTQAGTETSELPRFNTATPNKIVNPALAPNGTTVFSTIQAAVDTANAGDVIGVAPGIYREALAITRSGTAISPIYIQALDPNDKPVIDGQMRAPVIEPTSDGRTGRQVALSASHIVWDSIDIINCTDQMMTLGPSLYNNGQFVFPWQFNEWYTDIKILRSRFKKSNSGLFGSINVDGVLIGGCTFLEMCRGSDAAWESTSDAAYVSSPAGIGFSGKNVTVVECVIGQGMGEGVHCGAHNINISYGQTGAFLQCENLIIRNCRIFDTWRAPIYIAQVNGCTIERNVVYYTGDTRFWFGRQSATGGYPRDAIGIGSEGGRPGGAGWSTGYIGSKNVTIRNNVIMGGSRNIVFTEEPNQTVDTVKIQHNLIYKPQGNYTPTVGLIANFTPTGSTLKDLTLENNIFYDASGRIVPTDGAWNTVSGTFTKRNNLWSHTPPSALQGTNDIVNSFVGLTNVDYVPVGPWPSISEFDTTSFRLIPSSPAINAGASSAGVNNDFFGTPRGGTPDIGAHELT